MSEVVFTFTGQKCLAHTQGGAASARVSVPRFGSQKALTSKDAGDRTPTRGEPHRTLRIMTIGYFFALGSAFFNGIFVAFMKIPSVAATKLHPVLFNGYVSLGVFLSSWLVVPFFQLAGTSLAFTWFGFLAGAIFVIASSFSFIAASNIGLSTGQGVWGGTAIVVSFLWGTLGPEPICAPVQSVALSLVAVGLLLIGVLGIVKSVPIGDALGRLCEARARTSAVDSAAVRLHESVVASDDPVVASDDPAVGGGAPAVDGNAAAAASAASTRAVGLAAALMVGLFGGSVLVPASFAGEAFSGQKAIALLPSFGIGALSMALLTTGSWYARLLSRGEAPPLHLRAALWAGCLSGATWNAGNLCSIVAINYYSVPFGVAYPLLQASLVFGGLLGIFVFGELKKRKAIAVFFASAALVLGGAVLLGMYGPSKSASPSPIASPPAPPAPPASSATLMPSWATLEAPVPTLDAASGDEPPSAPWSPTAPPAAPPLDHLLEITKVMVTVTSLNVLGYFLKRASDAGARAERGLGFLIGSVALPALIMHSLATIDLTTVDFDVLAAVLIAKLGILILGAIIGYLGRKSHAAGDGAMRAGAVALFCTNSDDIGLAYPFFLGLFPEEKANILFLLSAAQALLIAPWCFVLMEIGDGQAKARAKSRAKAKALCELPQAVLPQAVLPQAGGALESSLSTCFLDSVSSQAAINGMTSSDRAPRTAPPLRTQGNKIVLRKVLLNAARNLACNRLILSALAGLLWNLIFGPVLPWYALEQRLIAS